MQKRVPIAIAAVLTACGAVATTSNDTAESAPQKTAKAKQPSAGFPRYEQGGMAGCFNPNLSGQARVAAERIGGVPCNQSSASDANGAGGDPWVGSYTGDFDGGGGEVAISRASGGRYNVEASVGGPGCSGSISGVGTASGNRLSFSDKMTVGEQGSAICTMTLAREGNRLSVSGAGECHFWSGMSCGMNGTVTRQGRNESSSVSPPAPTRAARPWIVGAWVSRGFACGGDGVNYEADGTFASDIQSGRWQLTGSTLIETTLHNEEAGGAVRNPRPVRSQILSVAPNRNAFTMRTADGEVWQMVRCR